MLTSDSKEVFLNQTFLTAWKHAERNRDRKYYLPKIQQSAVFLLFTIISRDFVTPVKNLIVDTIL